VNKTLRQHPSVIVAVYLLGSLFSLLLFLKNAWVAEDAFIILRSVDQFLLGNGFRWNPHERVQVYTSPLWYLLIIASTAFCKTLYLNLIGLSLLLHAALLGAMARLIGNAWRWLAGVLLLTLSQAFFDFTASGLEYPLVYLLLGSFTLLYLRNRHMEDRRWLALTAGLALVTRHDLLFLLAPMLLHLAWLYRSLPGRREQLLTAAIFISPLALWTLFSLLYYGLPFPNTAYAKLGISGVSRLERLERGLIYLSISLKLDPLTPLLLLLAAMHGFGSGIRRLAVVSCSLLLAFAYITWIGADYMAGRFYAPLYLVAVMLLCSAPGPSPRQNPALAAAFAIAITFMLFHTIEMRPAMAAGLLAGLGLPIPTLPQLAVSLVALGSVLLVLGLWQVRSRMLLATVLALLLATNSQHNDSPWRSDYRDWGKVTDFDMWWNLDNVSRERYFIFHWTSLYAWLHRDLSRPFPDHPWCHEGIAQPDVALIAFAGMMPYCMGTAKIAVDVKALTDPLLPRLPKRADTRWLSGGVNRIVPDGYLESLQSGENRIRDPDLARYYDRLVLVTQGEPLWRADRLKAIAALNLGLYEPWLDAYRTRAARDAGAVVK
jgi:arabinofuranosyltransferase